MQPEHDEFSNLGSRERRSILLLDSDSVILESGEHAEEFDLSTLKDRKFDRLVDAILGYEDLNKIERSRGSTRTIVSSLGKAKWSRKSRSNGFSSSYRDIKAILSASGMKDGDTFVDLGASYGRVGCVIGANFPNTQFIGYEIVPERCVEAQRIAKFLQIEDTVNYFCNDISADDFTMPDADWYFLYDSLNNKTLSHIFEKIYRTGNNPNARLIAKYTGSRSIYSDSPYLEFISSIDGVRSFGNCWFYRFKQLPQGDTV